VVAVLLGAFLSVGWAEVSVESLLDEMTDLGRLTRMPEPCYITRQFSSYDRAARSPSDGWFANNDAGNYLRVEEGAGRKEYVMMDAEGPGAIVRIWSANPGGTLRVYIDQGSEPVLEAGMSKLLDGDLPGFPKPLSGVRGLGHNLYFPIPYAIRCRVTSDAGGFYYHVNYRTYDKNTIVRSFVPGDLDRLSDRIQRLAGELASPRAAGAPPDGGQTEHFDLTLAPNAEERLAGLSGPREICEFIVRLNAENRLTACRSVVLYMTFDGKQTVLCPIGDFFATAPGQNPFESLPLGVTPADPPEMYCHWRMPFGRSARISVRNRGPQTVHLAGSLKSNAYDWDEHRCLLFHAGWRIQKHLPSGPHSDWTHLETTGRGRFVGGALHLQNHNRNWWGEGDEKIYVDGEAFPSTFGTGTEDYYGYAWCSTELFTHAYHNQAYADRPDNYGDVCVSRFHIFDDIPFRQRFRFDLENWHIRSDTSTTRAAVSYWYGSAEGSAGFTPPTAEDLQLEKMPTYVIYRVPGAIEGEKLEVLETSAGAVRRQKNDKPWSNEGQLWWDADKPGDRLTLAFDAPDPGRKHVLVQLTRYHDYAQVRLGVNGRMCPDVIDLYVPGVDFTGEIDLGEFDLARSQNTLTAEIIGANPQATKNYVFGLDYIRLK